MVLSFTLCDIVEEYGNITSDSIQEKQNDAPKVISSNPLDSLDCECFDIHARSLGTAALNERY